jgi:hypothetical protein
MGFFTWIKGLSRKDCTAPLSFDEWLATPPPKIAAAINRHLDREIARRRGSNPPAPGNKPAAPAGPPTKPQPTGGRLIYADRDPGPVPPRLPDDDNLPSDEQMERWKLAAIVEHAKGGEPMWHTAALLAIAWARQQQAQSPQLPPPGADPVATDGELAYLFMGPRAYDAARRAIYNRGRADERTAILRALGVEQ